MKRFREAAWLFASLVIAASLIVLPKYSFSVHRDGMQGSPPCTGTLLVQSNQRNKGLVPRVKAIIPTVSIQELPGAHEIKVTGPKEDVQGAASLFVCLDHPRSIADNTDCLDD